MINRNRKHSGAQNFDDQLSVTNSKRSGNLTDSSSSQSDTSNSEDVQIPETGENTSPKKKNDDKKDNKKRSKS